MSWVVSDQTKLESMVLERDDTAMTLEIAEVQLSREANKKRLERERRRPPDTSTSGNGESPSIKVPYQSRPKHRLIPVIGTKVDTVDWGRKTLADLQSRVQRRREDAKTTTQPEHSAVFVAYSSPAAAQRAYREITFHPVASKATPDRFIGVRPKEALWTNLNLSPASRITRSGLATALFIATILFWTIPVGFVGAISNIKNLADTVKPLGFLQNLPPSVMGLLSGLLPPLVISTLISSVPNIFRCGYPRGCHNVLLTSLQISPSLPVNQQFRKPSSRLRIGTLLSKSFRSFS